MRQRYIAQRALPSDVLEEGCKDDGTPWYNLDTEKVRYYTAAGSRTQSDAHIVSYSALSGQPHSFACEMFTTPNLNSQTHQITNLKNIFKILMRMKVP